MNTPSLQSAPNTPLDSINAWLTRILIFASGQVCKLTVRQEQFATHGTSEVSQSLRSTTSNGHSHERLGARRLTRILLRVHILGFRLLCAPWSGVNAGPAVAPESIDFVLAASHAEAARDVSFRAAFR